MTELKLQPLGDALVVAIPADVLARLGLKSGDTLVLSEVGGGALRLDVGDAEHDRQLRVAREGMNVYREALRELAK